MDSLTGIRGSVLTFKKDPFLHPQEECYDYWPDGLVVLRDGHIIDVGPYADTAPRHPELTHIDTWPDSLIMPGFIDCHVHYVQSPMIGSYGDTLLDWLNAYAFPTESRFRSRRFADEVARIFFRQTIGHGTTTANVFATTFPESVDALFEESERYNARTISGKVLQDRNLPDTLRDTSAEASVRLSEDLLNKWHHRGRQLYAVIPRFAPTSTPEQLSLAGQLYRSHMADGVYMHTHIDEAEGEIEWVRHLFPSAIDYADVYDTYGLLGPRTVLAHCCIVTPREWQLMHEAGCGIAHCPASNLFLGDGEFKYWEAKDPSRPCRLGIGTDVGGGTTYSIPRQLGEAYKIAMLRSRPLNPVRSFYMATRGGAEVLHLEDTIGSIAPGYEADITVLDLAPDSFTRWRMGFVESDTPGADIFTRLFLLQTLAPDRLVRATYIAGTRVYDRDRTPQYIYNNVEC